MSLLRLDSDTTSLLLECAEGRGGSAPLWRYFGRRLVEGAAPFGGLGDSRALPSFHPDEQAMLSLVPTHSAGWFGPAAVRAHRSGRDWVQQWTACEEAWDGESLVITLTDDVSGVAVEQRVRLDPASGVLTLSARLTNTGVGDLTLDWLAAGTVPLPTHAASVTSWHGRHNVEFQEETAPLTRSTWSRENRRGLTSHEDWPAALVTTEDGVIGAHLAWSGNHRQAIEPLDDGRYAWQAGAYLSPGEVILAEGESYTTPEWLVAYGADRNAMSQAFHADMRARVTWPTGTMAPRPVHINSWEGFYFDHDEAALMALADSAAALGVERFVLDDGWFKGRDDDTSSLGDWVVEPSKYPRGLGPLAQHVRALGMEFGLWVEPEMVNPDSDLYRAHPEWVLGQAGRRDVTARNQLVLDLTRADVRDYLFERVAALLDDLPIAYLKWDHNRVLTHAGERAAFSAQVDGAYALFARLRAAYPAVEIEACAGGGGRIDAGILRHTHRFWTSDCIDATSRVAMQRAFLAFFPPEVMGSHVGASPAHSTGRMQGMDFRAAVALPGHFGLEFDTRHMAVEEVAKLTEWLARYKDLRGEIHGRPVWQGAEKDGLLWQAFGDADGLLLFVTRLQFPTLAHPVPIRLPILAERDYRVEAVWPAADTRIENGAWLAAHGLTLPPQKAESVRIVRLTAL